MRSTQRIFHPTGLLGLLGLLALAGCDSILGPGQDRVAGILGSEAEVVEVPAAARVGEAVTIRIETGGYPGCSSKGETWVVRDGSIVVVRPFDFVIRPGVNGDCVHIVQTFMHEVELEFDAPGSVTIRVVGSDGSGSQRVIEREIVIEEG